MTDISATSKILKNIDYYDRIMFVTLQDGKLFSYNHVPKEVFDAFAATNDYDAFYREKIVPFYSFQRMT